MHSIAGTLTRVNTVASALKRLLSRDDRTTTPDTSASRIPNSSSSTNLANKLQPPTGSMKISDQVIEEVDEQMTITSLNKPDIRPTAQSIFNPVDVDIPSSIGPKHQIDYNRALSTGLPTTANVMPPGGIDSLLSTSAPPSEAQFMMTKNPSQPTSEQEVRPEMSTQQSEEFEPLDCNLPVDEFELLKSKREQERIDRQKELLARSISTQPVATSTNELDSDLLLQNLHALAQERSISPGLSFSVLVEQKKSDIPPADTPL
jgi:hypothetical protein